MAISAVTLKDFGQWNDGKRNFLVVTLTFSGNYAAGGDIVDLSPFLGQLPPIFADIQPQTAIYSFRYVFGTSPANGKVYIVDPTTDAQLAAAAVPAGITGDTITALFISPQSM